MTISKDSLLFKTAYYFTRPNSRPARVNLCPFFWRLMFMLSLMLPLFAIYWAVMAFVGFWFTFRPVVPHWGERPCGYSGYSGDYAIDYFRQYSKWPEWQGIRLVPFFGVLLAGLGYFAYLCFTIPLLGITFLAASGILAVFLWLIPFLRTTGIVQPTRFEEAVVEMAELGFNFLKAKKSKLCPLIEVK